MNLVNCNGNYRQPTLEEEKKNEEMLAKWGIPKAPPTPEQEIAELKRQNAEMRRMIEALANGDIGPEVSA